MITTINTFKHTLINEAFVNVFSIEDRKKYIKIVFDIMVYTYKDIPGGFLTAPTPEALLEKTNFIKMVRRNGNIVAAVCYKMHNNQRKLICGGSFPDGKKDFLKIIQDDINLVERGAYTEVSGKMEEIMIHKFNAKPIPNTEVSKILNKEIELDNDGFHYYRKIGNVKVKKILLGNIKY